MENYNKKGKFFLIVSIVILVASIYRSLNGLHNNVLTGSSWFILLGSLLISVVNIFKDREKGYSYYSVGNLIIVVTVLACYIAPQLIRYK